MTYGYTKQFDGTFEDAVSKVKETLAEEGFGVLTEIDVQGTLKKKLDVDTERYSILGACNPAFAYKAIQVEPEIGLLLPCNVILYEKNGAIQVSAIIPTAMMSMIENDAVQEVAREVEEKLKRAIDAV